MKVIPLGNTIICIKIGVVNDKIKTDSLFQYEESENIDEYEIIDMHFLTEDDKNKFNFNIGDKVVSCAIGTPVKEDNIEYWLIKPEYIMAKILD